MAAKGLLSASGVPVAVRLTARRSRDCLWSTSPAPTATKRSCPGIVSHWLRIAELVARYRDLPLGAVDASVVAPAERLGVTNIATVDHRHLSVVRANHAAAFTLLP